jgi:hypothetical protein
MFSFQKSSSRLRWATTLCAVGIVALFALQLLWLRHAYTLTYNQFVTDINSAFENACQKEQTYRIPVSGIVPEGNLTIQSCGREEVRIIRHCPNPDTIVYDNVYGQSVESIINRAFRELRESIIPLNLYCLADLFAGELSEKKISVSFVIERFNPATGDVLESSVAPDNLQPVTTTTHVLVTNISETEALRANLHFSHYDVLQRMEAVMPVSFGLVFLILACVGVMLRGIRRRARVVAPVSETLPEQVHGFQMGSYYFDPEKNELQGLGETVTLAKKENAILYELCMSAGNVVGRDMLLYKYWEGTGLIYSRSLDTYIAKLRKLLSGDPSVQIVTIKSVGYKLTTIS